LRHEKEKYPPFPLSMMNEKRPHRGLEEAFLSAGNGALPKNMLPKKSMLRKGEETRSVLTKIEKRKS
ncbi:MAG TPA: hypothetical protein H9669_03770, partial [Firmicutes bacterium]|nr:hypothetical protein [Bacillota bacterium]